MSIRVRDLRVTSSGGVLVDVSDLELHPGRALTLVGESGSGKSLLAHAIMGTLPPELRAHGTLEIDGQAHDAARPAARRRLWGTRLALLPQEPVLALDPTMRIGPQVAEGVVGAGGQRAGTAARRRLADVGLAQEWDARPHTLSGGMAQRVAFAAATVGGAHVLLADEPSKGLDEHARADVASLLLRHVDAGGVLLTITHDLELARRLGGDVLVLHEAHVVERGPVDVVLDTPCAPYTQRLLAAEPQRWPRRGRPATSRPQADLLTGRGLAMGFDGKRLFTDLDLTVRSGQRLALTGPSGSGKTTLGNVLLGLVAPDRGTVTRSPALAGGRLQKLYQDPALAFPPRVPLAAGFEDVLRRHGRDPGRLDELLAAVRVPRALLERRPGQVSGGELQRIAIVRAMLVEPLLLFADEPTSRLDLLTQQETVACLLDRVDRDDVGLVLVTHDTALAAAVTDTSLALPVRAAGDARAA